MTLRFRRGWSLEFLLCAIGAAALVIARSIVFIRYEQLFDADQAVVGLMAKHLSEFRTFPLFFYGQPYMLGVQSWLTVPFFWLGGPTVAMVRLPLVLINVAVAVSFIAVFVGNGGRPVLGLISSLPIVATSPVTSGELLGPAVSVEPFMYVVALWMLRGRPACFGAVLCLGSLHREFTIFALPAILAVTWIEERDIRWRVIARASAAFAAVWIAVDVLKRCLDGHSLSEGARFIGRWLAFESLPYGLRLWEMLTTGLADMFGLRPYWLTSHRIPSSLEAGSWLAGAAFLAGVAVSAGRLLWLARPGRGVRAAGTRVEWLFCLYLGLISVLTLLAYGLNTRIDIGAPAVLRYVVLILLLPIALLRAYLHTESNSLWRAAVCSLIILWAAANTRDNARLARDLVVAPPPNEHRILADYLTGHGIRYGWATYWDCYVVDFLARERVVLASTDVVRIDEYQARVARNRTNAVTVRRWPCDEGTRVSTWCLVD